MNPADAISRMYTDIMPDKRALFTPVFTKSEEMDDFVLRVKNTSDTQLAPNSLSSQIINFEPANVLISQHRVFCFCLALLTK